MQSNRSISFVVDQENKGNIKDQHNLYLAKQAGHSKWGAEERDISRCTGITASQNIEICSTKSFSCGDNQTSHVTGTQLGDMWHDTALLSFSSGKVFFLFLSRFFSWHLSSAKFKHVFLVLRELLKFDIYVEKGNSEYSRSSEIAPYPTPRRFSSFHQALRPSSPQSKHLE